MSTLLAVVASVPSWVAVDCNAYETSSQAGKSAQTHITYCAFLLASVCVLRTPSPFLAPPPSPSVRLFPFPFLPPFSSPQIDSLLASLSHVVKELCSFHLSHRQFLTQHEHSSSCSSPLAHVTRLRLLYVLGASQHSHSALAPFPSTSLLFMLRAPFYGVGGMRRSSLLVLLLSRFRV